MNDIQSAAKSITQNINSSDLQDYIKSISQKKDVSIIIADTDGNVLFSQEAAPSSVIQHMSREGLVRLIKEANTNGDSFLRRFDRGSIMPEQIKGDNFPAAYAP